METVTIEQLQQLMREGELHLMDVREVDEYKAGHIPGAQNMPLSTLETQLTTFNPKTTYHIVCRSGSRSARAVEWLTANGIRAINVEGGTLAWLHQLEKE